MKKVTDEQIIKVLKNAWENMPGNQIADAYLTTSDVANILEISHVQALRRLKDVRDKTGKIRGVFHGRTWLWIYNGDKIT